MAKQTAQRDFVHAGTIIKAGDPMPDELVAHIEGRDDLADTGLPETSPGSKSLVTLDADVAAGDAEGMLPDGFPHASKLEANGLVTEQQVREATDKTILDIDGIGDKGLRAIRETLGQPAPAAASKPAPKAPKTPANAGTGETGESAQTPPDAPPAAPTTGTPATTSDPAPAAAIGATPETPPDAQ